MESGREISREMFALCLILPTLNKVTVEIPEGVVDAGFPVAFNRKLFSIAVHLGRECASSLSRELQCGV